MENSARLFKLSEMPYEQGSTLQLGLDLEIQKKRRARVRRPTETPSSPPPQSRHRSSQGKPRVHRLPGSRDSGPLARKRHSGKRPDRES